MKTIVNSSVLTAAALSLAVSLSNQAMAERAPEIAILEAGVIVQTVSIPYSQAELATDGGRDTLYSKIRNAAQEVCGPTGLRETGSLSISVRNRKCYQEAVDAAVSQVESGQVASISG